MAAMHAAYNKSVGFCFSGITGCCRLVLTQLHPLVRQVGSFRPEPGSRVRAPTAEFRCGSVSSRTDLFHDGGVGPICELD